MIGVVPARGGSKGILRKNLQLVDGQPLFLHAAATLAELVRVEFLGFDDHVMTLQGHRSVPQTAAAFRNAHPKFSRFVRQWIKGDL